MKPIFVKHWHGIPLGLIEGGNKNVVAGTAFYASFYEKFFEAHTSWDDLAPDWVDHKLNSAKFIPSRLVGKERVLSIGCGIGIIEKYLLESGISELEIQEVSEEPLKWVRTLFAKEAVHVGMLPECLGSSEKYDYMFLSSVDYCLEEQEWTELLRQIYKTLKPAGRCLIITPTFHLSNFAWSEIKFWIKLKLKTLLSFFGIYDLGQLVGWRRNAEEFQSAMISSGFKIREEGFLGQDAMFPKTYWIEGEKLS